MAYSARPTSTDSLTKFINQSAHGFVVGNIVTYSLSMSKYVLASADSLLHSQSALMVSIVTDVNNFYATQAGRVSGIQNAPEIGGIFTLGTQYYLSVGSPGDLTATMPLAPGEVVLSLFVADTTTSGYFQQTPGVLIGSSAVISQWYTVNTDTQMIPSVGYYCNSASNINLTLPPTIPVGQVIGAATINTGPFTILQNDFPISPGNQVISFVPGTTTAGSTGSIALAATLGVYSGSIIINSVDGGTNFTVLSSVGNFTVT
jgi:hypothetical protein